MRLPLPALALVTAAALLAQPAVAQDGSWEDLGEANFEDDSLKDADDVEPAVPVVEESAAPPADLDTMKLVSAGTSAALLAFTGAGVGVALAFTNGALWSLMPSANRNFGSIEVPVWLGFWTLPVLGATGGAAFGALPSMEPLGVGAVSAAAAGGLGFGALLGWGVGYGSAILLHGPAPGRVFPNMGKPAWSATLGTGVLLGAGLGAAAGAAVAAPFFVPGVLEAMREGAAE